MAEPALYTSQGRIRKEPRVEMYVDPVRIARELAGQPTRSYAQQQRYHNPTLRELEIIITLVEQSSYKRVAHVLGISEQTVKNHVMNLMNRLDAHHRTHLVWLLWPVIKDYWDDATPLRMSDSETRVWKPGDPERRTGYQRRRSHLRQL